MRSTRTVRTPGRSGGRRPGRPGRAPVTTSGRSRELRNISSGRVRSQRRTGRKHAGGHPFLFIPALVLAYAVRLHRSGRGWLDIVRELESSGNGRYDVRTLTRRILRAARGQITAQVAAAAAAGDVAGPAVTTGRGLGRAARPSRDLQRRSKPAASMSGRGDRRPPGPGTCRKCGCTESAACMTTEFGGACFWVKPDLCSGCAPALARRLLDHPYLEA